MCIPTNPYKQECFGDFVENDAFAEDDTALGLLPPMKAMEDMAPHNVAAEPYRHMLGTGYGPNYLKLTNGKLVRPGTAGTSLRPLVEPNEEIDWPALPSYYNWFPKEKLEDYFEKTTWREVGGIKKAVQGEEGEDRLRYLRDGQPKTGIAEKEEVEYVPWDSSSIPLPRWAYEKDENEIVVEDPKSGRVIGMSRTHFEEWLKTMQRRKESGGSTHGDTVEYDQERFVSNKSGFVYDMSKIKYVKLTSHRWNRYAPSKTGRNSQGSYQKGN